MPSMTSQPAFWIHFKRASEIERTLSFYIINILRPHKDEFRDLVESGRDVRNTIRILNRRHKFMAKAKRMADMKLLCEQPKLAEILRSDSMAALKALAKAITGEF